MSTPNSFLSFLTNIGYSEDEATNLIVDLNRKIDAGFIYTVLESLSEQEKADCILKIDSLTEKSGESVSLVLKEACENSASKPNLSEISLRVQVDVTAAFLKREMEKASDDKKQKFLSEIENLFSKDPELVNSVNNLLELKK